MTRFSTVFTLLAVTLPLAGAALSGCKGVAPSTSKQPAQVGQLPGGGYGGEPGPTVPPVQSPPPPTQQSRYLEAVRGDFPVIITAPHAGWLRPEVPVSEGSDELESMMRRTCSGYPSGCRGGGCLRAGTGAVESGGDTHSYKVAHGIADLLTECLGARPYVVIGLVARDYLDYNRDAFDPKGSKCALEDKRALPFWSEFHDTIEHYSKEVQDRFGAEKGLLVDVHSYAGSTHHDGSGVLALGTSSPVGTTTPHLRSSDSQLPLLYGDSGFAPVFENEMNETTDHGATVLPSGPGGSYGSLPSGGYVVRRFARVYSEHGGPQSRPSRPMLDSVQLEFPNALRNRSLQETIEASGKALCSAILTGGKS